MQPYQDNHTIAAVVVGYHPDFQILDALLLALLDQSDLVILIDNSASADYLSQNPIEQTRILYHAMPGNLGLGAALNVGFSLAASHHCDYVATFDQDSAVPAGMLANLREAHQSLSRTRMRCAAVGPCFYDRRENGAAQPFPLFQEQHGHIQTYTPQMLDSASPVPVDTLITSGMLVSLSAWQSGLHYDPWLMVDFTDTDWCFRARAAGWHLYACPGIALGHALSDTPPVRLLGLNFLRYSPLRRYYYFRNTLYFVRQPYVSWAWRRRLLAGIAIRLAVNPFIDNHAWASLRMSLRGLWDGLKKQPSSDACDVSKTPPRGL